MKYLKGIRGMVPFLILSFWVLGLFVNVPAKATTMLRIKSSIQANLWPSMSDTDRGGFLELNSGLPHFALKVKQKDSIDVAFLGGSITHMNGWRQEVMDFLIHHYPACRFRFLEAGIPSLGSVPHAFRLQTDVLDKMTPDLLFVEAAVNDEGNGTPPSQQIRALEGIVRHVLLNDINTDIVFMAFADEVKNEGFLKGNPSEAVKAHQAVARHYQLPFLNLAKEVFTRIQRGEFSWEKDFKNLHPAPFGQHLYFKSIKNMFLQAVDKRLQRDDALGGSPNKVLPSPLDVFSYKAGRYISVQEATQMKGFSYIENWTPEDSAHVRSGFVHVPILQASDLGATLQLDFYGDAVGLAVAAGPDAGVILYRVDKGEWKYLDLFTRWSQNLHLPWYEILSDRLENGPHQLELKLTQRVKGLSKGTAIRIVHFLVNKGSAL